MFLGQCYPLGCNQLCVPGDGLKLSLIDTQLGQHLIFAKHLKRNARIRQNTAGKPLLVLPQIEETIVNPKVENFLVNCGRWPGLDSRRLLTITFAQNQTILQRRVCSQCFPIENGSVDRGLAFQTSKDPTLGSFNDKHYAAPQDPESSAKSPTHRISLNFP